MTLPQLVTDSYNRRARLQPVLLTALPLVPLVFFLYPEFETYGIAVGGVACFGGIALLSQIGRERGKRLEPNLFSQWGGMPSIAMLRHRDTRLNGTIKNQYHSFLSSNIPGLTLPTQDEELNNPKDADDIYSAASDWLREKTRDITAFRLIYEENMNYGFRRNYWALKPCAISIDVAVVAFLCSRFTTIWNNNFLTTSQELGIFFWLTVAVSMAHLVFNLLFATQAWVKVVAEAYARQLLAASNSLSEA